MAFASLMLKYQLKYTVFFFSANDRGVNLLTQKVPAIYVRLQEVVQHLADERKAQRKDPVLHVDQYKSVVHLYTFVACLAIGSFAWGHFATA